MRTLSLIVLAAAVAWSAPARAAAIDVQLKPKAFLGKGKPEISIAILEPIAGFHLQLTRNDGHRVDVKGGGKPGQKRTIVLEQPEGHFSYQGTLTVNFPSGDTGEMPLKFDTELLGPLELTLHNEDVDLAARKVRFTVSRPAAKASVRVLMDTGKLAFDGEVPFGGAAASSPLEVSWPAAEGRVMQIAIRVWDTSDFYTGVEISPWRVDIPHEEVNFDSGKWDVRADQRAKLDKSHQDIAEVARKYGALAPVKLFIAGHTDTVGDEASNRKLSLNRAKSIGAYFRKKGLRIPIFFEGLGEEALAVGTQDEQDEPKNRRAEYILAIEDPVVKGSGFKPTWRPL